MNTILSTVITFAKQHTLQVALVGAIGLSTVGTGAAYAAANPQMVPSIFSTALQQNQHGKAKDKCTTVSCFQSKGDVISAKSQTLITKAINELQSSPFSGNTSALVNTLTQDKANIAGAQQKLNNDTQLSNAQTDFKALQSAVQQTRKDTESPYITYIRLNKEQQAMSSRASKLEGAVNKSSSGNAQAQRLADDYTTQVKNAGQEISSALAILQGPNSNLSQASADLKAAQADLQAARNDAQQLRQMLRTKHASGKTSGIPNNNMKQGGGNKFTQGTTTGVNE